jgi:hypothetical protein
MNLSIRTEAPETGVAVNEESVDRIFVAVGDQFSLSELENNEKFHRFRRWLMLRHLRWCAYWYDEAAASSSSGKDQIRRLERIAATAKRLSQALNEVQISTDGIRTAIGQLDGDVNHRLAELGQPKDGGPYDALRNSYRRRSPFEWFVGQHLPLVYRHMFCQQAGISRGANKEPSGPYIRFVQSVLAELGIANRGKQYSCEAIARALSGARAGRARRKPRRS